MKMFLGSISPFGKGFDLVDGLLDKPYDQNEVHLEV